MLNKEDFIFEEVDDSEVFAEYSEGCSGSRSDCCTRVCTRMGEYATKDQWGKFVEVKAVVVQY